ncbi:MAG: putative metal-binding motif-containing protein [Pseudomonadota bacterium]
MRTRTPFLTLVTLLACGPAHAAAPLHFFFRDADGDGFGESGSVHWLPHALPGWAMLDGDCDDSDATVHPGATETCDGMDQDCDGTVDEEASDALTWYGDADGDGYGNPALQREGCSAPTSAWVADGSDCDDLDPDLTCAGAIAISTCEELQAMEDDPTASYYLVADIDCAATADGSSIWGSEGFDPIDGFEGQLDGRGHSITDLYIERPSEDNVGLFARILDTGAVHDLGIEYAYVSGNSNVGILAGYTRSTTGAAYPSLEEVWVSGSVFGSADTGGLVGEAYNPGVFHRCAADVDVVGGSGTGGLVGHAWDGHLNLIEECFTLGTVTGTSRTGGLVGNDKSTMFRDSYSQADVTGTTDVGGLVGYYNETLWMANMYFSGSVAGDDDVGGLIGESNPYNGDSNMLVASWSVGPVVVTSGGDGYALVGNWWTDDTVALTQLRFDRSATGMSACAPSATTACAEVSAATYSGGTAWYASRWDYDHVWESPVGDYPTLVWW